jgi:shikimate dehydrogenase
MRYIYLLGYPLGHSISPAMQNAALRERKIRATCYAKHPTPPDRLQELGLQLRTPVCLGANVTVPYKQAIVPLLDELTPLAHDIGAVNTILKRHDANGMEKLVGDNTDVYGFLQALATRHILPAGMRVAILGAGGAAAAAAYGLAQQGAHELALLNRTPARGVGLADRLKQRFPSLALSLNDWDSLPQMQLVVNATSVGMAPHAEQSPLPAPLRLASDAVVFDLVYNPPVTRLLREAQARGARRIGGLEMLIHQGARAFELWTGTRAPIRVMRAAAARALTALINSHPKG